MERFFLALTVTAIASAAPQDGRIFGGAPASPRQFPFIVSLRQPDHFCGGAIINNKWIVTAAHCIYIALSENASTVLAGTTHQQSGGVEYNISKAIRHEGFNFDNIKDDIGLIQIDGIFEFNDFVQPVEFVVPDDNAKCVVAGWGDSGDVDWPEELQYVEVTALSLDDCKDLNGNFSQLYLGPEQVCALGGVGIGACHGDSGGPLVCNGGLAGLVSYDPDPCVKGFADVYTRPSSYVEWINENIEE